MTEEQLIDAIRREYLAVRFLYCCAYFNDNVVSSGKAGKLMSQVHILCEQNDIHLPMNLDDMICDYTKPLARKTK